MSKVRTQANHAADVVDNIRKENVLHTTSSVTSVKAQIIMLNIARLDLSQVYIR